MIKKICDRCEIEFKKGYEGVKVDLCNRCARIAQRMQKDFINGKEINIEVLQK